MMPSVVAAVKFTLLHIVICTVCCYVGWYEITWISPTTAWICGEQLTLDYVSLLSTMWNVA